MKNIITSNQKYSISVVHRIIAYVLLMSQLLTSCIPNNIPLPFAPEGGLELAELNPPQRNVGSSLELAELSPSQVSSHDVSLQDAMLPPPQSDSSNLPSSSEAAEGAVGRETPTCNTVRYGTMLGLIFSALFTLSRSRPQSYILVTPQGSFSSEWLTYSYPENYDSIQNQFHELKAKGQYVGLIVADVEQRGACYAYRDHHKINETSEGDVLFHQLILKHREQCVQRGVTALTTEFAEIQRQIFKIYSIENNQSNHSATPISADSSSLQLREQLPVETVESDTNFNTNEVAISRRKLFELVDQRGFNADLRDAKYGVHLWCYLLPGNLVPGKTNLGWPCSFDSAGWWVLAGNNRGSSDQYFDNSNEFYTNVASWKIQYLDCRGHIKHEEKAPRSEIQNKVIRDALELRMIKCLQGSFSTLKIAHIRDGSWLLINPTGKLAYPITNCARFFAGGYRNLYPNIFNGAGIYFYARSFLTGFGSQIGEMYPECKKMVTSRWSSPYCADTEYLDAVHSGRAYLKLQPESNQECEDYSARMRKLEEDMAKTKHELEMEKEAVKQGLQDYKKKYEELERMQKDLMNQYQTGERSIERIVKDLATIRDNIDAFNQQLKDKKKAIVAELQAAEEKAERDRKRLETNQALKEKLAYCQQMNLAMEELYKSYAQEVSKAFDDIQSQLHKIMEENGSILKALQGQQQIETWESVISTMDENRKQDIDRQKALKSEYIAGQAVILELLLNTSMGSEDRKAQLNALHARDQAIFDEVNAITARTKARDKKYDELRIITENTTQEIDQGSNRLQQQLSSVKEELVKSDEEIARKQQFVKEKEKELYQQDTMVTECFQEAIAMQNKSEAEISQELKEDLAEASRLRNALLKLDQEERNKTAVTTKEEIVKEHQRIQDAIDRGVDLANQTAENVNQRLSNANALDKELSHWNNNFTAMMRDQNKEKLYLTMQWFLDRSKGFEKKMCAYLNNPILHNSAEIACNINSGFSTYLGSLDNNYMQIPSSVRSLYLDYRPQGAEIFKKLHDSYAMKLDEHQPSYQEMSSMMEEFSIKTANIFRIIYGRAVQANLQSQVKTIQIQMDDSVKNFITFNQKLINTFLNAIPRLLSLSASLYLIKALCYQTAPNAAKTITKQSHFLAHGSKMAIIPTLALMVYSLVGSKQDYSIGSIQTDRNLLLIGESIVLLVSTLIINMVTLQVDASVERWGALLGSIMSIYQFFIIPGMVSVTSVMPACIDNIPAKRLAINNAHANAILSTNILADRIASYADQLGDVIGSSYDNGKQPYFRHCNIQNAQAAEQQLKDVIVTFLCFYNSLTLLSNLIKGMKGYTYQPILKINFTAFLIRCLFCIFDEYPTPTINLKWKIPQPSYIEMILIALVMSMSVKHKSKALDIDEEK